MIQNSLKRAPVIESIAIILTTILNVLSASDDLLGAESVTTEEAVRMLKVVSTHIASNRDAIQTWKGQYLFQEESVYQGEAAAEALANMDERHRLQGKVICVDSGSIRFAVDNPSRSIFTAFEARNPPEFYSADRTTKVRLKNVIASQQRSLLRGSEYWNVIPNTTQGPSPRHPIAALKDRATRLVLIDPIEKAASLQWANVVDPTKLFSPPTLIDRWAASMASHLDSDSPERAAILEKFSAATEGEGEDLVYLIEWRNSSLVRHRFSASAGFNLTFYEVSIDGNVIEQMEWVYKKYGSTYIPQRISCVRGNRESNSPVFERVLELERCTVNEPLHSDEVSWRALGLADGDRILNRTLDTMQVVENDQLVEPDRFVGDAARQRIEASNAWMVVSVVVALASLFAILLVARKRMTNERNVAL